MIRFITFLVLYFSAGGLRAQFTAGNQFVGGGLSASVPIVSEDYIGEQQLSVGISPEFGIFRHPKTAIGLAATVGFSTAKSPIQNDKGFNAGLGPFVQHYFFLAPRFGAILTGRANFSYASRKNNLTDRAQQITEKNTALGFSVNASPGVFYMVSRRWLVGLDVATLNLLEVQSIKNSRTLENHTIEYRLGSTFSLGAAFRLRHFLP
ncbi:hypothetical protein [Tellurirhabdus bombi]|uniref:hypothetical protein n=1 Tax=Tellurirhabdus bombi TaxID=2907205 RepID=UPI001F375307|nr:hypothetical protein [Tellurirhabdus bombi]